MPARRPRLLPRRLVVVLALALVLPALPSGATPLPPVVESVVRTLPLGLGETVQALTDEQLVGVTWDRGQPAPAVQVRWRTPSGWTPWETPEDTTDVVDGPERATARPGTEPLWRPTGADAVAVRVDRAVAGLRLDRVGDGDVQGGGLSLGLPAAHAAVPVKGLGTVLTRADWGADERMRRGAPSYASTVRAVVVHHTAGGNDYRPEDVPARLRADYAYHVRSRGWADLGYNLVVDRFGRIWEGRAGGVERPVIGTHAAGFNTGTLGVSVMGDYTKVQPNGAVLDALARVSAFAARTYSFDVAGTVVLTSGGSPKYGKGQQVRLPRVHGHKDTGQTACPGSIQDQLPLVRARALQLTAPPVTIDLHRVYGAPLTPPAPIVVRAWLSRPVDWTMTVHDAFGRPVAVQRGRSDQAVLRWNGLTTSVPTGAASSVDVVAPALPGRYTWTVRADDGVHPAVTRSEPFEVRAPGLP